MLRFLQILVSTLVLASAAVGLSACGQQGPLYLPTAPAAAKGTPGPQAQTVAVPPARLPAGAAATAVPQ